MTPRGRASLSRIVGLGKLPPIEGLRRRPRIMRTDGGARHGKSNNKCRAGKQPILPEHPRPGNETQTHIAMSACDA
jgi:hypothetical protein